MPYPAFDIRQHLDRLTTDGGSCGKDEQSYHCPLCNSGNFKVSHKTGKWNTWGCDCAKAEKGKQAIKDAIAPLTWEKPAREKKSVIYTYHTKYSGNAIEIAQVRRSDDGAGKRKFSQWHKNGARWVTGLPEAVKERVHLYQIFEDVNQSAIANGLPILIVEGEGKVDQLLALGIGATCPIGGAGKWNQYGYSNYLKDLDGAAVVICPDRDEPGIKHAELIAEDFPSAKWLYPNPSSFLWSRDIPKNKGFDIGDWIDDGATEADILGAIGERRAIGSPVVVEVKEEPIASPKPSNQNSRDFDDDDDSENQTRLQRDYWRLEKKIGNKISFDEATQTFLLDGQEFEIETAKITLSIDYGIPVKCGKEDVMDICIKLAKANTFNSVVDYLERCQKTPPIDINSIAPLLLGNSDPIASTFLRKWLIAAVARAYEPGCKADNVVIFHGKQDQGKSSFFKWLVPDPKLFNQDAIKGGKINDEVVRTAHRVWLAEVAEIDKLFKRSCASEIKTFMTLEKEWIRPLYARLPLQLSRHSLMAGTTNQDEFLTDETGNRRYWIIEVLVKSIDIEWLKKNRDGLWSAAVQAYKQGEQWWLDDDEKKEMNKQNKRYQMEHPWQGLIAGYVECLTEISTTEILFHLLKIEHGKATRSDQMQVAGILKTLGFQKTGRRKEDGNSRPPIWEKLLES